MRATLSALVLFCALAPAAHADYAVLRSGQRLHISGYQRDGGTVRLYVGGGTIEIAAEDLVAIEPEDVFPGVATPIASGPFGNYIHAAAQKHGVDEALISSVIAAESGFNPRAVSRKRAQGLMQLVPQTASRYAVTDAFDPAQNIDGGTRYLKDLLKQYHGDLARALAAYNAGPQRVQQYRGVPPYPETRAYVKRVSQKFAQSKKKPSSSRTMICPPEQACKDTSASPPSR
jgi:hypothetical protein